MNLPKGLFSFLVFMLVVGGIAVAADKIIYFTAGPVPTTQEKIEIAAIKAQAAAPYTVSVRNSLKARNRTTTEAASYYAGAIPPNYRDGGTDASPPYNTVYSYTDPPDPPALVTGQAVFSNGDTVTIPGGGSITLTISSSTATVSAYTAPDAS